MGQCDTALSAAACDEPVTMIHGTVARLLAACSRSASIHAYCGELGSYGCSVLMLVMCTCTFSKRSQWRVTQLRPTHDPQDRQEIDGSMEREEEREIEIDRERERERHAHNSAKAHTHNSYTHHARTLP
jgi:hypothetical protein